MDALVTLIIVLAALLVVAIFINRKLTDIKNSQKPSDDLLEIIRMLQTGSKEDRQVLLSSLQENTRAMNERLDNAARVISQVQKNIGEFSEIGRGMKDLQDFLRSPKVRGNIGEQVLKELLKQFLPQESFNLQYTFKSGDKVDAAIKTSAGIVPVDAKMLDNPNYSDPAPDYHVVVLIGYDDATSEFITHDPGTAKGQSFRYDYQKFFDAIGDYLSAGDQRVASKRVLFTMLKRTE